MNKKYFILLLIFGLIFFISCKDNVENKDNVDNKDNINNQENIDDKENIDNNQNSDNKEEIELNYTKSDLENILLTINDIDITLDLSHNSFLKTMLLSLKLYKSNITEDRTSKYVLSFSDYEITIYDNDTICYIDNDNELDYLFTLNDEFDYLDTILEGDILDFNKYTENQDIKVSNSNDDSIQIENKLEFLNALKKVKYIKLSEMDNYNLGDLKYKIQIDEQILYIYNKYIVIGDNLYIIIQGSFTFLNNLKFSSSSGWLPWL